MKNHELLDMIGDANEDYVQAADSNVARPRFHWKAFAACAACVALIVAAYPASMAFRSASPDQNAMLPLHAYTVAESGGNAATYKEESGLLKAPASDLISGSAGDATDETIFDEAAGVGSDAGPGTGSAVYSAPSQDVPVEQEPYDQYNSLYENAHLDQYPEWYGGAYIDYTTLGEPSRLVVCIVEGFRTPELEQQIAEWCGEGVWTYRDVKYSRGHLQTLMERLNDSEFLDLIDPDNTALGWGVYEQDNCIKMEWRAIPSDTALAELAKLDPDGDAIQVQVSAQSYATTDELRKGPALEPAGEPVPGGARTEPSIDETEASQPAQYDTLPKEISDLPQVKYDVLGGAGE